MKKNFVKPSISIDAFNMEHILLTSGIAPEKTNTDAANEAFDLAGGFEAITIISLK